MRKAHSTLLLTGLACFLGFASGARAGVTIDVVFQDAPVPSGITIWPNDMPGAGDTWVGPGGPGCTFTGYYYPNGVSTGRCMDVILTTTESFHELSVSVGYDSDNGLKVASMREWVGLWVPVKGLPGTICEPTDGIADNGGVIQRFGCVDPNPGDSWRPGPGTYRLGTIIWDTSETTPGIEAIWAMFGPGDGMTRYINGNLVDISASVVLGSHVLTIVPEPGTAALLGLGLVGLLLSARRRRAPAA